MAIREHLGRLPWGALPTLVALAGAACGKAQPPAAPRETLVGEESLARVEKRELSSGPVLSGTLQARERAELVAEVSGSVRSVTAELGDRVARGQILVRVEMSALGAGYASAQEGLRAAEQALELARTTLARTEQLAASGSEPPAKLDADRSAFKAAEAQLAAARAQRAAAFKQLEATVIRSPIDGVISERSVHQGDVVAPGAKLVTIIEPSSMRLEASVTADDLPTLKQGARVEFSVRGFPGRRFVGAIERIAPSADATTRRVQLLVSIPNPDQSLLAGLFAEGRVTSEQRTALSLPEDAVERSEQRSQAVVIRGGKAERVEVRLGLHDPQRGLIEIQSGLQEGERVITGSARDIPAGTPVKEIAAPATEAQSRGAPATPGEPQRLATGADRRE